MRSTLREASARANCSASEHDVVVCAAQQCEISVLSVQQPKKHTTKKRNEDVVVCVLRCVCVQRATLCGSWYLADAAFACVGVPATSEQMCDVIDGARGAFQRKPDVPPTNTHWMFLSSTK